MADINEEITGWLNKQHEWIREAGHRILAEGGIDDADVADLVELAKEAEPKKKTARTFPSVGGGSGGPTDLRLDSIGPVEGIDALNPKTPLEFGAGNLAVVYGPNGSGKSGYTRILTKACGKSHSAELKPDVYKGAPGKRECTFHYTLGGKQKNCVWTANTDPVEDLKPIDVFDTECGRIYLEKDTHLSYDPPELALFTDLVETCKLVEVALLAEQGKLVPKLPKLPAQHALTTAGKAYESLSKDTTTEEIKEMVTWTASDEAALTELQARLKEADPAAAAKKKRTEKGQIEALRDTLQAGISALGADSLGALRSLEVDASEKRKVAKEGAQAMGATAKLDGVGSVTWKAMWDAAKAYSTTEAYPDLPFPPTGDGAHCVLCHQDLDEEAKQRLQRFEEFVKGVLEVEASKAEKALVEGLEVIPARPTAEGLTSACQAAGLEEELQKAIEAAWTVLEALLAPIREGNVPDTPPEIGDAITGLPTNLEELAVGAETAAKALEDDAKSSDRSQARAKAVELQGKKWITEQAEAIQAEMDRVKEWAKYEAWKKKTVTTGVSRKAGEIAKQLITDAYIQRFNDELKGLGASRIQVELVKATTDRGRPKHTIQLRDVAVKGSKPVEILSEGERRIVALAAFIADVTGRKVSAPFVFDDPISSLDQDFEEKAIDRLVTLSQDRQVLVFTHRLTFLGMIAGKAAKQLHCVNIERQPWGTGQPGGVPIYGKGTLGALKSLKNEALSKAKKALATDGYEAYNFHAQKLCSDFRKIIERIVETVFLAGVIQRHSREVHTKNVVRNLLRISQEDCDFIDEMMTEFSKHEHSQSPEAPVSLPEPDELEAYLDRMIAWHTEFEKRKIA